MSPPSAEIDAPRQRATVTRLTPEVLPGRKYDAAPTTEVMRYAPSLGDSGPSCMTIAPSVLARSAQPPQGHPSAGFGSGGLALDGRPDPTFADYARGGWPGFRRWRCSRSRSPWPWLPC
jgi:hypothetical protein